jgi:hypothetical protein
MTSPAASYHGYRFPPVVRNLFGLGRHLLQAAHHRLLRTRAFRVERRDGYLLTNNGSATSKRWSRTILVNLRVPAALNLSSGIIRNSWAASVDSRDF